MYQTKLLPHSGKYNVQFCAYAFTALLLPNISRLIEPRHIGTDAWATPTREHPVPRSSAQREADMVLTLTPAKTSMLEKTNVFSNSLVQSELFGERTVAATVENQVIELPTAAMISTRILNPQCQQIVTEPEDTTPGAEDRFG